jgi:site-specific DNA-methyltransferase (adenine-specific)
MLGRIKFQIEPLVNEILDQLPAEVWSSKTTTFFDPAIGGGQFVREIERRLREAGHTDVNISGRVYGCESSLLSVKYAVNKYKLAGTYSVGDFLAQDFGDMKFDVIVGNPPYVDSSVGKIPIYDKFVKKSTELSTGIVALIIPSGFAISDERNGDSVRGLVYNKNTKAVKFLDSATFQNADVSTLYFLLDKSYTGPITVASGVNKYNTVYVEGDYIWKDKLLLDILKKCGTEKSQESWIKFNRIEKVIVSNKVKTVSCITKNDIIYDFTTEKDNFFSSHKVVSSFLPNAQHHLDVMWYVSPGISVKKGYTVSEVNSKIEGKNLTSYLKSSLCKFIHSNTRTSRSLRTPQLKFLPKIDLTKSWTDAELYQHFGLTQEEIDYIEANVK